MPFNPKTFIDLAKELQSGSTEAHYRSVINRAYYGAFGYIKEGLNEHISDGASVHKELIKKLENSVSQEHQKASHYLKELFRKRKKADYNYREEVKAFEVEYCVNQAEKIIDLFDKGNEEEEEEEF